MKGQHKIGLASFCEDGNELSGLIEAEHRVD